MDNTFRDSFMVNKPSKHSFDVIYLRAVLIIIFEKGMIVFNIKFKR